MAYVYLKNADSVELKDVVMENLPKLTEEARLSMTRRRYGNVDRLVVELCCSVSRRKRKFGLQ